MPLLHCEERVEDREHRTLGLSCASWSDQDLVFTTKKGRDCAELDLREIIKTPFVKGIPDPLMQKSDNMDRI